MITTELKHKTVSAIIENRKHYPSDAKQARSLDISSSQLSRIKKGQLDNVISESKWITIARRLDVTFNDDVEWKTAKTAVFNKVYGQLFACQDKSISAILCDRAGLGKTYTAKAYVKGSTNAVYIDCSQVKTKQKLVRQICKEFGVDSGGRYQDVYEDLVYYLRSIEKPLIILDEAGDLNYDAFLECKGLWNATERCCGWYMMGADGLKKKIENNKDRKKVGYAEIFDRYGKRFQKVSPDGKEAFDEFCKKQVAMVAQVNNSKLSPRELYAKTGGSLRRVFIEIQKQ